MPTFYQRPLTWLLVAIFVLFDALILAGALGRHSVLGLGGIFCQLFLVAQWTLFGSPHWLVRSATALLSVVVATLLVEFLSSGSLEFSEWSRYVAAIALILLSALAGMIPTLVLKKLVRKSRSDASSQKWQISLLEIFGLTFIVACGSWLARGAFFARQLQHPAIGVWLGVPCLAGIALAFIGTRPFAMRWGGVATSLAMGCLFLAYQSIHRDTASLVLSIALLGVCLFIRSFEPTPTKRDETQDDVIPNDRLETLRAESDAEHLDEQV